uniref:Chymotrypsin n=1 Tax=Anoplophora glabripennis TaxID=217634 RepID=V5G8Q1_ANOGL
MKTVCVYITLFVAALASPRVQHNLPFKNLYVEPLIENPSNDVIPRIINGKEAVPHSRPYQAYLIVLSSGIGGWKCGGSLISPRHILTAAHCLAGAAGALVHLGAHDVGGTAEATQTVVESKNLIVHSNYNESDISNDIGLVVLDEPVELNEYIDVIALAPSNINTDYTGYNATVSGWGLTEGGQPSSVLLEANVSVMSNAQCRQIYSIVIDTQLCTLGNEGEAVCDGDSGGPLTADDTQIGIVSYGSGSCSGDYPSGYTRVNRYLDWLEENTGIKF